MARYTDPEIEDAIRTVASLIDRFGDAYWPILERLEQELEARRSRAARLQRYLQPRQTCNLLVAKQNLEITDCDFKLETTL